MGETQNEFATKLNQLFKTVLKPDGAQYTQNEVVEGTHDALTRVYLWKLRKGQAANPSYQVIQAVSQFFGVDPSYFFSDQETANELLDQARQSDLVDQIALRASLLNEESKQAVLGMIDYILKVRKGGEKDDG